MAAKSMMVRQDRDNAKLGNLAKADRAAKAADMSRAIYAAKAPTKDELIQAFAGVKRRSR